MQGHLRLSMAVVLGLAAPLAAHADAAILMGFTTGARVEIPHQSARFLVGAGPDLLTTEGLCLSLRTELTHALDGGLSLTAGWAGPGIVGDEGLPLGLALGPSAAWTTEGAWALGARARLTLGLWYARAALELDVSALAPLSDGRESPRLLVSLALRWVPWTAFRL